MDNQETIEYGSYRIKNTESETILIFRQGNRMVSFSFPTELEANEFILDKEQEKYERYNFK